MTASLAIDGGQPVRDSFLVFGKPCLGEEEEREVLDTLRSGWIGTGPKALRFEQMFAEYVGCKHALAVNSATAALHLSLLAAGIKPGDEVITSPLTFAATANVAIHAGARPVFADIDPATLNIAPENIERAITGRTRAIIVVHFGGLPCQMAEIMEIARQHNLTLVEDAAHAVGARYNGRLIGNLGNLACFSFYANKNLTTAEGGMVTTDDDAMAERIAVYRLHGLSRHAWQRYASRRLMLSDAIYPGYKYNMPDLLASLGIHQLRRVEDGLLTRERYARVYDEAFAEIPGVRLQPRPGDGLNRHGLHLYVLVLDLAHFRVSRNQIIDSLLAENIGAALHYRALHMHPYYRDTFGYEPEDFPAAASVGESILSLPLTPCISEQDAADVIEAVRKVLAGYRR
ncbi:DegT/DnrJ/EryC1/StrS family aminotransferase [Candidatus Amarolinea aalborgensis]|uniref:DegT/DnrJ/EryC1/StrS family aminotransferase n=1 Tax=Candidatus Amarolinea aalborgensis TaxID=2249329 RepID=UPI003BFA04F9